jgi:hypothetical protein
MRENNAHKNQISRQEYVSRLLDAYRKTPGTAGPVRRQDRKLAEQLYEQIVPLTAVENALVLASARRLLRSEDAPPLDTIRSLHYFRTVIDEVMKSTISDDYILYLRRKIAAIRKTKTER